MSPRIQGYIPRVTARLERPTPEAADYHLARMTVLERGIDRNAMTNSVQMLANEGEDITDNSLMEAGDTEHASLEPWEVSTLCYGASFITNQDINFS